LLSHREQEYQSKISVFQNTDMVGLAPQKRKISVFLYTVIVPSPCFETRICIKVLKLFIWHVLKHGDSKISMFQNTVIQFCLKKFKIPILKLHRRKKTKFIEKKFQQHAITYTGHWFSVKKKSKIKHFLWNLHVLYTEIFTLKAYNSAKKQQMTEIF